MLLGQHLHDLCCEPQQCPIDRQVKVCSWHVADKSWQDACWQMSTNVDKSQQISAMGILERLRLLRSDLRLRVYIWGKAWLNHVEIEGLPHHQNPGQQWSTHRCWSSMMNLCNMILFRSSHRNHFAASKLPNLVSELRNKGSDAIQTASTDLNSHRKIRYLTLNSLLGDLPVELKQFFL